MKKYDRELMVQELDMRFDEAVELFSDETLESMMMVNVVGGGRNTYCGGAQCITGCNNNCGQSCSGSTGNSGNSGGSSTGGATGNSNGSTGSGNHSNNTGSNSGNTSVQIFGCKG